MVPPVIALRLFRALGLLTGLVTTPLLAEQAPSARPAPSAQAAPPTSPPPATTPAADARACFPACRDGFTCAQGTCVSLCNPPCPSGLECVEGRRCEPPLPQSSNARPYEPPPPSQKAFEERSHALVAFHWGLPGNVDRDGTALSSDATLGFNLRADTVLAKYVLIGPLVQFSSWRTDVSPKTGHNYYFDLDLALRFRVPITTSQLNYQLWLGMPVGLSVSFLGDQSSDVPPGIGWNIGVLFGGAVHFTPKFGLFAEAGWEQHRFEHKQDNVPDLDLKLQQALLNFGFILRN